MSEQQWWWSLTEGRAVTREERGRDEEVLGPYPTREAAEGWRDRVDTRNEAWDEADREWKGDDDRREPGGGLGEGAV